MPGPKLLTISRNPGRGDFSDAWREKTHSIFLSVFMVDVRFELMANTSNVAVDASGRCRACMDRLEPTTAMQGASGSVLASLTEGL